MAAWVVLPVEDDAEFGLLDDDEDDDAVFDEVFEGGD